MLLALAFLSLLCALLPAALFLANLRVFQAPPFIEGLADQKLAVSVLIPARNEDETIADALESVLASHGAEFEIVVLDDASEDRTAEIVQEFVQRDGRVRLERAPAMPSGWNGKQHACHCLSQHARHPCLLFIDADVRLAPDALARLLPMLEHTELLSGIPRQITGTFSEKLLIPLIHFVLLGYLPLERMRTSREPALGAGCGQLFLTTAEAYFKAGGHAAIRSSFHDGLHLPRLYRRAGLRTDLADITRLAHCRMYQSNAQVWHGLAKNAHQGMGAWRVIFPMTFLLFFGQILPFILLFAGLFRPMPLLVLLLSATGAALAWLVRFMAAAGFRQSWLGAALHPLGIAGLLGIQWRARARRSFDLGSEWKGRIYHAD